MFATPPPVLLDLAGPDFRVAPIGVRLSVRSELIAFYAGTEAALLSLTPETRQQLTAISHFRPIEVNRELASSDFSQHLLALAIDYLSDDAAARERITVSMQAQGFVAIPGGGPRSVHVQFLRAGRIPDATFVAAGVRGPTHPSVA